MIEIIYRAHGKEFKSKEKAEAWVEKQKNFESIRAPMRLVLADINPDMNSTVIAQACSNLMALSPEHKAAIIKALS